MADNRLVCLAEITGAHGVRGLVKLRFFGEDESLLSGVLTDEEGKNTFAVKILKPLTGEFFLAEVNAISDRDEAQALKGQRLYIPRNRLPETEEGEFYLEDLKGLPVFLTDGTAHGTVRAVHNFGAGEIVEVKPAEGPSDFLLLNGPGVVAIDLESRRMTIRHPDEISEE